ncbi:MAG: hypothetical protein ABJM55_16300, partial [Rhodopirellula bahusiensis]
MPAIIRVLTLTFFVTLTIPLAAQSPGTASPNGESSVSPGTGARTSPSNVLRPDNLVAWCIVPFDVAKRTPAERAQMLVDLDI